MPIEIHQQDPELFRSAIRFTAAETGFPERLVEKDYFCAVVLESISRRNLGLVFKGGTSLAKVHAGFFRLSEDLDFSIPVNTEAGRGARKRLMNPTRAWIDDIETALPGFELEAPLIGANNSTQYNAELRYRSALSSEPGRIKFEVGLREPCVDEPTLLQANTMAINPLNGHSLVEPVEVRCLSFDETVAEKVRAGLTRRDVAIRDYFDIDHLASSGGYDFFAEAFLEILRRKIEVAGTGPVDTSDARTQILQRQLDAELQPVLRPRDFEQFDLGRAVDLVRRIADQIVHG